MYFGDDGVVLEELQLDEISEFGQQTTPQAVLRWAFDRYGEKAAIVTSFQAEGMVILDMAVKINPQVRVITIDTGRLHEESYAFFDQVRDHYGIDIEVHFPYAEDVRKLVSGHGMNLFYKNVEARLACCDVRKVKPLERILSGLDAWITGLRKDQSSFRFNTDKVEIDHAHGGIVKINPLADWAEAQVEAYTAHHEVSKHPLYAKGYASIGCAPCTRPVQNGEDSRAGRWWWESDKRKECGMHCRV